MMLRAAFRGRPRPNSGLTAGLVVTSQRRAYNFGSPAYNACFAGQPSPDGARLRADALTYLEGFDPQAWYDDPVASVVDGVALVEGEEVVTCDAFNQSNGRQLLANEKELARLRAHISSWTPPSHDYREAVRRIEQAFLGELAGALIGNQAVDFKKQDGVTEMEESVEANHVERRLNDLLLEDELRGNVAIGRAPAFVGCVSNFSNFLDLFRKTLRNIELGVPVVVLSRSNTTQHMCVQHRRHAPPHRHTPPHHPDSVHPPLPPAPRASTGAPTLGGASRWGPAAQ
jgi:hypothetical protein